MIRFNYLQNRQGKTRLAKYYVPLEEFEKCKVEYEVHRLVVNRDAKFTNFVEFRTHKVIYRRYAGLFFSVCVDITDNELAYLECIHLFVEILDHFFSNVCELDLVFNFHKSLPQSLSMLLEILTVVELFQPLFKRSHCLLSVGKETLSFWVKAFSEDTTKRLENFGFIQFRPGGEYHSNNPEMSKLLHKAVREKSETAYAVYQQHLANRPVNVLRDLLEFKSERAPIPVGKVEPAVSIVQRFCTGAMSLGAISRETHEAIAIAMNRIGGKSNSGEGGEDPIRWKPLTDVVDGYSPTLPHLKGLQNGDIATSATKQVASGRFGVTPTFLVNADQLEIKVAQGAKPGEGGQLPGKKVSAYIARLRSSKPGVPLISPPPHHDIYSIQDLTQFK